MKNKDALQRKPPFSSPARTLLLVSALAACAVVSLCSLCLYQYSTASDFMLLILISAALCFASAMLASCVIYTSYKRRLGQLLKPLIHTEDHSHNLAQPPDTEDELGGLALFVNTLKQQLKDREAETNTLKQNLASRAADQKSLASFAELNPNPALGWIETDY